MAFLLASAGSRYTRLNTSALLFNRRNGLFLVVLRLDRGPVWIGPQCNIAYGAGLQLLDVAIEDNSCSKTINQN